MAAAVATPLEKQFSAIAGVDSISSTNSTGQHADHPAVRPGSQHRRRRAGRAGDDRTPPRQLPRRACPRRRRCQKVNPADSADHLPGAVARQTLPLSQVNEYAETVLAQRHVHRDAASPRSNIQGSQKLRRAHRRGPARAGVARGIGIDRGGHGGRSRPTSNRPTGTLDGADQSFIVCRPTAS